MAGNSSSWHKVSAGPLAGEKVFIPPQLVKGLGGSAGAGEAVLQEQLAGGYGGLLNDFPPGPLTPGPAKPAFEGGQAVLETVPLIIKQVDGDHAVKAGTVMGPLAVVDTPFGHSILHVTSGKALLYVNDGSPGKPKPTEASSQAATQMMIAMNTCHDWSGEDPESLSADAALVVALGRKSPLASFKPSTWVKGEGPKQKKSEAPNEGSYQAALEQAEEEKSSYAQALAAVEAAEEEAAAATSSQSTWPSATVALMPNVYNEDQKTEQAVQLSPDGVFALKAQSPHSWALYHAPSGYPVATGFASAQAARDAVSQVPEGIDWSHTDKASLMANKANFKQVVAANQALQQAALKSTQPEPVNMPAPEWAPRGGVPTYPTLQAHEATIQNAYKEQMGFVRSTSLKQAHMKAVHAYQDGAYSAVNKALWGGTLAKAPESVKGSVRNLDYVMSLSSVPENTEVVRAQGKQHPLYALAATLQVGDQYESPAYDSASLNHANSWGGGDVRVRYRLPKGAKAVFINALTHAPNATGYTNSHAGEHECLIARNSRWQVVGKTVDEAGKIELTVELAGQTKPKDLED